MQPPPQWQQRPPPAPHPMAVPPGVGFPQRRLPDPDRTRLTVGLILYSMLMLLGGLLNLLGWFFPILTSKNPLGALVGMLTVTAVALIPLVVYVSLPLFLDRYDPEPTWALGMALGWGGLVATGAAGIINDVVKHVATGAFGKNAGEIITVVVSAPLAEEAWKGLLILGFFFFLRREFDGVVDGVIYAVFCALGFAAVENIQYYWRALGEGELTQRFWLRGVIAPWGHPLYTSMTGLGIGVARETSRTSTKLFAPVLGYGGAVVLHSLWNLFCVLGGGALLLSLLFWAVFLASFVTLFVLLVQRKGKIIRQYLRDEVLIGTLTPAEAELAGGAFGSWKAKGKQKELVAVAARLAVKKWHTARANEGKKKTISADYIGPLRQELLALRREIAAGR